MLHERKCRSPVLWTKVGSSQLIGPELVRETTNTVLRLKRDLRQREIRLKSYADDRRKPLEFGVGDIVMLKVCFWKGVVRLVRKAS